MATDPVLIIATARGWIGTPYQHQASLKGIGCDCLGLLRGVWLEVTGSEPESLPPYSPDWAEATGQETLYLGCRRHLNEIDPTTIRPGNVVLFRIFPHGPAKHCGIAAEKDGTLTMIHARQNKQVNEEPFSLFWRKKLAYAFEAP